MTCLKCSRPFLLDPKVLGLSDTLFLSGIRKASSNQTQYFTANQLYGAILSLKRPKGKRLIILGGVAALCVVVAWFSGLAVFWFLAGLVTVIFLIIFLMIRFGKIPAMQSVTTSIDLYAVGRRDALEKLIEKPTLGSPPPEWRENDIYDYGVERLVVVENDLMVDLFVRNGWHAENHALVISSSGYPHYLEERAQKLLDENPSLPVYVMPYLAQPGSSDSDATQRLTKRLRLSGRPVVDLGFSEKQARQFKGLRRSELKEFPLDLLPYGALALGTAAAVVGGFPLMAALSDLREQGRTGSGGGDFG